MTSPPDTKERLIDAAERLFAEQGFARTSLRDITTAAGANLASVNYHFGGKDGLLEAIFDRRLAPVNSERLRVLAAFQAAARPHQPELEQILWAFLAPPFQKMEEWGERGRHFMRIIGRMHSDPRRWADFFKRQFDPVAETFQAAFAGALPELDPDEVVRRMHYLVGAMAHTFCWGEEICPLAPSEAFRTHRVLSSLVSYAAAGMRAPQALIHFETPLGAEVDS